MRRSSRGLRRSSGNSSGFGMVLGLSLVSTILRTMTALDTTHRNRLADETSPYLRQHAHNPVDWYPWGTTALERAQRENKPILLSIGYSACHWCHVMAHESFEDPA